jgi:hypothetical protein
MHDTPKERCKFTKEMHEFYLSFESNQCCFSSTPRDGHPFCNSQRSAQRFPFPAGVSQVFIIQHGEVSPALLHRKVCPDQRAFVIWLSWQIMAAWSSELYGEIWGYNEGFSPPRSIISSAHVSQSIFQSQHRKTQITPKTRELISVLFGINNMSGSEKGKRPATEPSGNNDTVVSANLSNPGEGSPKHNSLPPQEDDTADQPKETPSKQDTKEDGTTGQQKGASSEQHEEGTSDETNGVSSEQDVVPTIRNDTSSRQNKTPSKPAAGSSKQPSGTPNQAPGPSKPVAGPSEHEDKSGTKYSGAGAPKYKKYAPRDNEVDEILEVNKYEQQLFEQAILDSFQKHATPAMKASVAASLHSDAPDVPDVSSDEEAKSLKFHRSGGSHGSNRSHKSAKTDKSDQIPQSANTADPYFLVRIKLWCKDGDDTIKGGHEVFQINSLLDFKDLKEDLKTKFRKILKKETEGRRNLSLRCYWSVKHKVTTIKVLWAPNVDEGWVSGEDTNLEQTILTAENCKQVMQLLKSQPLPTMSVTITVPEEED